MNSTRLLRLRRELSSLAPPARCPECDGPIGGRDPSVVLFRDGTNIRPTCSSCGLVLDASGKAILRQLSWCTHAQRQIILDLDPKDWSKP